MEEQLYHIIRLRNLVRFTAMEKPGSDIAKNASQVSFATLISRILGYVRDMLIASFFGATMAADAFFVAYRIPNLLRKLLGEGSLSTSFIPVYTEYITTRERGESAALIRSTFGVFGLIFIALTVPGIIFAPQIVALIAPGFLAEPEKFSLTVSLTRIMFPFLTAIGLGAITLGILNSWKKFFIPAIAPSMLSLFEIGFILFLAGYVDPPVKALAYGVVAGGFAQFAVQIRPIVRRTGRITPLLDFSHPGIRRIGGLMLPAIVGLSIMQINSFVDTICATLLGPGSVTHLYYGNRLMQFPLALFGTAVATVMLPLMSGHAARKDIKSLKDSLSVSLRSVSFLIMPASVGFILFGSPIIQLLFERGMFESSDTRSTYSVLALYSTGLIFYAGVKIFVSAFHSLQDTRTPVRIASLAMAVNVVLNIIVVTVEPVRELLSAGGLAAATASAAAVNFILLGAVFRKRHGLIGGKAVYSSMTKHLAASAVLGLFIYYGDIYTRFWSVYLRTPLIIAAGAAVYLAASKVLGSPELGQVRAILSK